MKRGIARIIGLFILAVFIAPAWGIEDIAAHPACTICGMDRGEFGHSRMLVAFEDGRTYGTCSLRCAAWILQAEEGKKTRSVKVADYETRDLIDAADAKWVIGGKRPGVMTRIPKWAFRNEEDRERFLRVSGGARAAYGEALREAQKELE